MNLIQARFLLSSFIHYIVAVVVVLYMYKRKMTLMIIGDQSTKQCGVGFQIVVVSCLGTVKVLLNSI